MLMEKIPVFSLPFKQGISFEYIGILYPRTLKFREEIYVLVRCHFYIQYKYSKQRNDIFSADGGLTTFSLEWARVKQLLCFLILIVKAKKPIISI